LCGCQNIEWIFPCTAFIYLFLLPRWQGFTMRYELDFQIEHIAFSP